MDSKGKRSRLKLEDNSPPPCCSEIVLEDALGKGGAFCILSSVQAGTTGIKPELRLPAQSSPSMHMIFQRQAGSAAGLVATLYGAP